MYAATVLAASSADAQTVVEGGAATLRWAPAPGAVEWYHVFVSRNGAPARDEGLVYTNEVTLSGQPGEVIRVLVRAYGHPYGPTEPYEWGADSELSDPIVFASPPPAISSVPFLDCASCRRFELRQQDGQLWVSFPHPSPGSWEVVGIGEFLRGITVGVLRERTTGMLYVAELTSSGARYLGSIAGSNYARSTVLPPADLDGDGLAEFLVHDPVTGVVEFWDLVDGDLALRATWNGPRELRLIGTGDIDGDRQPDLWFDAKHGMVVVARMRAFDDVGTSFLGSTLIDSTPHDVADYDGDGVPDVFWRDDLGAMAVSLVRGNPNAPTLDVRSFVFQPGDAQVVPRGSKDLDGEPGAEILLQHQQTGVVTAALPAGGTPGRRAPMLSPGSLWRLIGVFW